MGEETLPTPLDVRVRCVRDITEIDRDAWDGLAHGPSPFLRHGFLHALQLSGSIGEGSGWHPYYVVAETDETTPRLVAAVPAFVKSHSYGEYIFDWGWARGAEQAGVAYYPKLVVAAPVTPATGNRILCARDVDPRAASAAVAALIRELAIEAGCSSVHWLFCTTDEHDRLADLGFYRRSSFQFHWHNRGYESFDDFLAALRSRKRKQIRKERRIAREAFDALEFVPGGELTTAQIDRLDRFYRRTTYCHGGMDYLQPGFFHYLAELLPDEMQLCQVVKGKRIIAGALFLETDEGLYGRYWGCDRDIDMLHFEVAYYAGIERCIDKNIPLFEAGAQGEHKLLRGFEPSPTYSNHWLRHPALAQAIYQYLDEEHAHVKARMARLAELGPYRRDG